MIDSESERPMENDKRPTKDDPRLRAPKAAKAFRELKDGLLQIRLRGWQERRRGA
jgi:hypothetical protein